MEEGQVETPDVGQVETPTQEAQQPEPSANWYDGMDDETIGFIQNKGWDDPAKAVTAYRELEKFKGASEDQLVKLPKEDTPEEWAKVWNKLGRPESVDGYKIELPEGVQVNDALLNSMKEVAHQSGLNPKQFESMAQKYAEMEQSILQEHQQQIEQRQQQEVEALKKEWGNAFEERQELGRRFLRANLPEGMDQDAMLDAIEGAIGTAATLKLFAKAGEDRREALMHDGSGQRPFGYSPEQAKYDRSVLIQELGTDQKRRADYDARRGPDYEKMERLNKIIAGVK